jgi:8-oxo-dGTP pyrophosphatase MutT (NUDIX family)
VAKHRIEVIARGLLLHGSHVLLCRSRKGGYCYLPGGHIEFGESAGEALVREFLEETGLVVRCGACRLVTEGAFEAGGESHHELNLVFHVQLTQSHDPAAPPPPIASKEADIEFEWVELAAVVGVDLRPASIKAWIVSGGTMEPGTPPCGWISEFSPPAE